MKTKNMILASLFAALTAAGGLVTIPLPLVPFTLQVFFVLLAGALLGPWWGAASQLVYIGLGLVGLPVFARGASGLAALLGPTGGFLIGFVAAAFVIGLMVSEEAGLVRTLTGVFTGIVIIYGFGLTGLMFIAKLNFSKALAIGVLPFIPVDLVKGLAAALVAHRVRKAI